MTAPNRNTLWAEVLVDELAKSGIDGVCISPGSRSTPLTVAFAEHPDIEVFSHLDERSSAFFALGRSRRIGTPTPLVCTSGTAGANMHPTVMEASESNVPLLVLTADRPPELQDSGANQTTDQEKLYGDAVRYYATLPEPEPEPRKLRSLRVRTDRAVNRATGNPPGPVHLNVPFRKPLEPISVEGDVPADLAERHPEAVEGRAGPYVTAVNGRPTLDAPALDRVTAAVSKANRGLIVCGPANRPTPDRDALAALAEATGSPVLADPLSGVRFGPHTSEIPVFGGYDSYLDGAEETWPSPDVVLRFGASPTSKVLRKYLAAVDTRQFVVNPAGAWPEAEFTATDLLAADPSSVAAGIAEREPDAGDPAHRERFAAMERAYWNLVGDACSEEWFEGAVLAAVTAGLPDPATCYVSNSMPVRDLDRFARPRTADITALGNRGVSGIDGIVSGALGAGSATGEPLALVIGDLAYYHDMNGLLAVQRCDVDATIVLIDNDGGGIFHKLPIEQFDPPFTDQFRTPHGLDFEPTGELYGFEFDRVEGREAFEDVFAESIHSDGTQVLSVEFDSEESHRFRESLHERVREARDQSE